MLDDAVLLAQKEDVDYQSLPSTPTPEEFFLLSRVRGPVSVGQLCSASGLGREKTLLMLERLIEFGLVVTSGGSVIPEEVVEPEPEGEALGGETTSSGDYDPGPALDSIRPTPSEAMPAAQVEAKPITLEPAEGVAPHAEEADPPTSGFHRLETSNHGPMIAEGEAEVSNLASPITGGLVVDPNEEDDLFEKGSIAHVSSIADIGQRVRPGFDGGSGAFVPSGEDELFGAGESPEEELFGAPANNVLPEESDIFGAGPQVMSSSGAAKIASDSDIFGGNTVSPSPAVAADDVSDIFGPAQPVPPEELDLEFSPSKSSVASTSQSSSTRPVNDPLEPEKRIAKKAPVVSLFDDSEQGTTLTLSLFPARFDEYQPDPSLISADVALDPLHKKEILFVYEMLDQLTFYQLFGVTPDAKRKEIRSSYFAWSKRFHPDLFFRKEVGDFAMMAETIFKWVSKAHDVLANKQRRAEYDELLAAHSQQVSLAEEQSVVADEHRKSLARDLLIQRGAKLEASGDHGGAVDSYKQALSLGVDFDLLLKCATLLLHVEGRLDESVLFARGALKERPEDKDALVVLGTAFEQNGASTEALDAFERALDIVGSDPSIETRIERLRITLGY